MHDVEQAQGWHLFPCVPPRDARVALDELLEPVARSDGRESPTGWCSDAEKAPVLGTLASTR